MPKIINPTLSDTCHYCGRPAYYISINTKRKRCVDRVSRCPAISQKQEDSRAQRITPERRSARMKELSAKGHDELKKLHQCEDWVKAKKDKIKRSVALIDRTGPNNGMFGKKHTTESRTKMRSAAKVRDNTHIGRYVRTQEHRNALSERITRLLAEGKLFKSVNTRPERILSALLVDLNVSFTQQFLIQRGWLGGEAGWFRHCYDFKVDGTNVLIEVDGTYWHSLNQQKERDRLCEIEAERCGYVVIRFTESELLSVPDHVKERLRDILIHQ